MLHTMAYAVIIAATAAAMGLCLERLAALRRLPHRTAWIFSLLLSVVFPAAMLLRPPPLSSDPPPESATRISQYRIQLQSISSATVLEPPSSTVRLEGAAAQRLDRAVLGAWALASMLFSLYFIGASMLLRKNKATWQTATLLGQTVLISPRTGPALVGILRPRIVIPRWLIDEPAAVQALILKHEQEHIAALDPLLIRSMMLLLMAMPWNLPLWWQVHRLRQAIELDCDARVLRNGAKADLYGEALLSATRHAIRMPPGVVTMSEPVSALERRIDSLQCVPPRHPVLQTLAAITLITGCIGFAVALEAPAAGPSHPAPASQQPVQPASVTPVTEGETPAVTALVEEPPGAPAPPREATTSVAAAATAISAAGAAIEQRIKVNVIVATAPAATASEMGFNADPFSNPGADNAPSAGSTLPAGGESPPASNAIGKLLSQSPRDMTAVLLALRSEVNVRVLHSSTLVVGNNSTADMVSSTVPQSFSPGSITAQPGVNPFQALRSGNAGTSLKLTPRITPGTDEVTISRAFRTSEPATSGTAAEVTNSLSVRTMVKARSGSVILLDGGSLQSGTGEASRLLLFIQPQIDPSTALPTGE